MLSIGSVGSFLSIGSVGSAYSIFSVGSFWSIGSALSSMSRWSILSHGTSRGVLQARGASSDEPGPDGVLRREGIAVDAERFEVVPGS
jgi:hypothetical protein